MESSRSDVRKTEETDQFRLAICGEDGATMLRCFGDLVFLDTVHCMTRYGYLELAIVVQDEFGSGYPVAFMLSQTETADDWKIFIQETFQVRSCSDTLFL